MSRPDLRPSPKTDMQDRLRHIESECDSIMKDRSIEIWDMQKSIHYLAYHISYLARIVEKHLSTGET